MMRSFQVLNGRHLGKSSQAAQAAVYYEGVRRGYNNLVTLLGREKAAQALREAEAAYREAASR